MNTAGADRDSSGPLSRVDHPREPYGLPPTYRVTSLIRNSAPRAPHGLLSLFCFTLVAGPRGSLRLELSDTRVYEPHPPPTPKPRN